MKNLLFRNKYLIIVVLISLIVYHKWLSFSIFFYSDYSFRGFSVLKNFFGFSTWNSFGMGDVNLMMWRLLGPENIFYSIFGFLQLDSNIADKVLLFWPWLILSVLSSYFLIKKVTKSDIGAGIGSLVFCFNTYFLSINRSGHLLISLSSVFAVFSILFFIDLLEKKERRLIVLPSLFLFLSSITDLRIFYITIWVLFFYTFYYLLIINSSKNFKSIFNILLFALFPIVILLILSVFWIFPSLNIGSLLSNAVSSRSLFGNDFYDITKAITLFHPFWSGGKIDWFIVQDIPFYFWLVPIVSTLSLILNRKNKNIVFFAIVALLGIFLSKQVGEPLPSTYSWLFDNFIGFNGFREASKFYFLIVVGYSVLIGAFSSYVCNNFSKNKFQTLGGFFIIFLVAFLFLWNTKPILNGEIGSMYVSREIPKDYSIWNDFLLSKRDYFRVLWVPNYSKWLVYDKGKLLLGGVETSNSKWKDYLDSDQSLSVNERFIDFLKLNNSNRIFDISTVKYVVVPVNDIKNDNDPFYDFGGKQNPKIREWYISELEKISWLKKLDLGTKELVIYENENCKPYFRSFSVLYNLSNFNNLEQKYSFVNNYLDKEFNFVINNQSRNNKNLACFYGLFDNVDIDKIQKNQSSIFENVNIFNQNNINIIYNKQTAKKLFYKEEDGEMIFYTKLNGSLLNDNDKLDILKGQEDVLLKQKISKDKKYYLKIIEKNDLYDEKDPKSAMTMKPIVEKIIAVKDIKDYLTEARKGTMLELYSTDNNLINNPSFEEGSWQEKVGDCHNYDKNPIIAMNLDKKNKTDGIQSLQLEATRHNACVNQKFKVDPGQYIFSFDYQSFNSNGVGFYMKLNDANQTLLKERINVSDDKWNSYYQQLDVPEGANLSQLHIYAYSSDNITNNVVRYDNFMFGKLSLEKKIEISEPEKEYKKIDLQLTGGENTFEYKDEGHSFENVFINGSFEEGSWQEKVGDCHHYDDNSILAMSLNDEKKTDGNQSLQLEATRHIACTSKAILINEGKNYILRFNYQSDNSKTAGYYVAFDNPEKTKFSEKLPIDSADWKTFEKNIKVPEGTKKMTVYIYAYPTDNETNNIVRYDNFQLIELPDLEDRFYLVSEPKDKLVEPKETNFDLINPTKKLVHIKGATTPFFLAMSESYHEQWELQMNNEKIQGLLDSWWPFAKRDKVGDEYHYKLANFLNAWYVDTEELCKNDNRACTKNEDGSYDIEMVVEFWPQRWFYLGLLISGTTLVGCISYLGYDFIRSRKRKKKDLIIKKEEEN